MPKFKIQAFDPSKSVNITVNGLLPGYQSYWWRHEVSIYNTAAVNFVGTPWNGYSQIYVIDLVSGKTLATRTIDSTMPYNLSNSSLISSWDKDTLFHLGYRVADALYIESYDYSKVATNDSLNSSVVKTTYTAGTRSIYWDTPSALNTEYFLDQYIPAKSKETSGYLFSVKVGTQKYKNDTQVLEELKPDGTIDSLYVSYSTDTSLYHAYVYDGKLWFQQGNATNKTDKYFCKASGSTDWINISKKLFWDNWDKSAFDGSIGPDSLVGNSSSNTISGNGGNDVITGGGGKDTLSGGDGSDIFRFVSAPSKNNSVTITDFNPLEDKIALSKAIFSKFNNSNSVTPSNLSFNTTGDGTTPTNFLVFNTSNKTLYYDVDGNGTGKGIAFVTLSGVLTLTEKDYVLIP
jgi:Ca2+-binding RTX toxin-like protein